MLHSNANIQAVMIHCQCPAQGHFKTDFEPHTHPPKQNTYTPKHPHGSVCFALTGGGGVKHFNRVAKHKKLQSRHVSKFTVFGERKMSFNVSVSPLCPQTNQQSGGSH